LHWAAMSDPAGKKPVVGAVEVLKDEQARMWYGAQVLDMVGKDKLLISFENNVWAKEEFAYSRVRKPAKQSQAELDKFNPRIGDEVELRVNATDNQPAAWGAAVVKNIKHSFYFVSRMSNTGPDGQAEAIVEKSMLRAAGTARSLAVTDGGSLKQETFKVAPALREWIPTDDAAGCFARIEADAGLLFIKLGRNDLKLVGDEKATLRARMLLDVHLKHQVQIQNFQDVREKRLEALEKRRNRVEGTGFKHSIEIQIDPNFVRRVIGPKGESIRAVMQKFDVNIHIPDEDESAPTRTVRIFGNNMVNIEKARDEVEFIEEAYPEPIEPAMFSWIRGRGDKTLKLFKELTGLVYARLDRESRQLIVCGTRNSVECAMAMIETHMMYYPVFSQMDEEMEQLVTQLEDYGDNAARREWGWYHDEKVDDGYGHGGKSSSSKGKAKGGRGKGKGNSGAWDEDWKDNSKGDWRDDSWDDSWNDNWESEPWQPSKGKGKGAKSKGGKSEGAGRSSGKAGGKARREEEEEEQEEAWEDEPAPRARGRGKGAVGRSAPRGVYVAKEEEAEPVHVASRKMGKKGIRS